MALTIEHVVLSLPFTPETKTQGPSISFSVDLRGTFDLLLPGILERTVTASVRHAQRMPGPPPEPPPLPHGPGDPGGGLPHPPVTPPLHNGVLVNVETIAVTLKVFDPDGREFTGNIITLEVLKKYRDRRGRPRAPWSYTIQGESRVYTPLAAVFETVTDPQGLLEVRVIESVPSSSAPPLVNKQPVTGDVQRFTFDLYRVGYFEVTIAAQDGTTTPPGNPWSGTIRLLDPGGVEVGAMNTGRVVCEITAPMLAKSRVDREPRMWTLEMLPDGPQHLDPQQPLTVTATVIGKGRITTASLNDRLASLVGENGTGVPLAGRNIDGKAQLVMTIQDEIVAETLDMYEVLTGRLKALGNSTDIQPNVPIVVYSREADVGHDFSIDVNPIRIPRIALSIGPGKHFGPDALAVHLVADVEGHIGIAWHSAAVGTATVRTGAAVMEIALGIDEDGTPQLQTYVSSNLLDVDLNTEVLITIAAALGIPIAAGAEALVEYIGEQINQMISDGAANLFPDPVLPAKILMTLLGANLTYRRPRADGPDVLFEHIAAKEPDLGPSLAYRAALGRTSTNDGRGGVTFDPPTVPDTWAAENLKSKIKHIFVVMMENRSYDHVLGYRAQEPINDGKDGLTSDIMNAVNNAVDPHPGAVTVDSALPMHPLRKSQIKPNAQGRKTMIPSGVGHSLKDVEEQLAAQIDGPGGRKLNSPYGFISNFYKHYSSDPDAAQLTGNDVLGYYEARAGATYDDAPNIAVDDLPMYTYLANNFAYCDKYFCSHPGPTLPNRMLWLTGNVQIDRTGAPIFDNNHGDNFLLSRATTIFDVLSRNGVSWRVYESNPSVAMLRMFARYATNNADIRKLDELEHDIDSGSMPEVVFIEPRMHSYPEDDDHPPWDMWRGQMFIQRVYNALRRNNDRIWKDTLLLITYDEHGGLYDHVVPPTADVIIKPPTKDTGANPDRPGRTDDPRPPHQPQPQPSPQPPAQPPGHHWHPIPPDMSAVEFVEDPVLVPYGVRVPTFVVSPWVPADTNPDLVLDHCSILKTILARFCGDAKPFLSDRVAAAHSFEAFVTASAQRTDIGDPPPPLGAPEVEHAPAARGRSAINTRPLFRKDLREGPVDYQEISGRLARMLGR